MICSDEWISCYIQDFSSLSCLRFLMLERKFKLVEFSFVSCFITRAFMARINVFMHPRWPQFVCVRVNIIICLIQPISSLVDIHSFEFTAVDLLYHFCVSNFKFPQLFTHLINVTNRLRLFRIQFHLRILNVQFYLFTRFASFLLVLDSIVVPFLFLHTQHDHMELAIFFQRPIRNHRTTTTRSFTLSFLVSATFSFNKNSNPTRYLCSAETFGSCGFSWSMMMKSCVIF